MKLRAVAVLSYRRADKQVCGCLLAGAIAACAPSAHAQDFHPLWTIPGEVQTCQEGAVSGGGTVVGAAHSGVDWQAFQWTSGSAVCLIGEPVSDANGISEDGTVVVGIASTEACYWTGGAGPISIGDLAGGTTSSEAYDASSDGSVIVGFGTSGAGQEAFRWTSGSGMQSIGSLPGGSVFATAEAVSDDGAVVAGWSAIAGGGEAFRWTQATGMVGLGHLPGGILTSQAFGISGDGNVIVGYSGSASGERAFRWTQGAGMVPLDVPAGTFAARALATSFDGSITVGFVNGTRGVQAALWDAGGFHYLDEFLTAQSIVYDGWALREATGISGDGRFITGEGIYNNGALQTWLVDLVGPAGPCQGDLNGDNVVNLADLQLLLFNFGTVCP